MPDYKEMYFQLAAGVADAVELLIKAQQQGEDSYIKDKAASVVTLPKGKDTKNSN